MDRAIDQAMLFVLCTACALYGLPAESTAAIVAASLAAFSAAGLMEFFRQPAQRIAAGALFFAASCAFAPLGAFAPMGAYESIAHGRRWMALPWLAPLLLCGRSMGPIAIGALTLVWGLGVFTAWRSGARAAEERTLRALRDDLQEEHLALAARAHDLQERQDLEVRCAVLDERGRIAREIHDNVGHLLTRALLQSRAIAVAHQDNPAFANALAPLEATLDEALDTVRNSVHNLHETSFDPRQEMEEALRGLPALAGTLRYEARHLPRPMALAAVAIVREGLSNAAAHGKATEAAVALEEFPGFLRLLLEDNGTPCPAQGEGMGIQSMRKRAEALGGTFSFGPLPPPRRGSRIIATFPLQQEQS